MFTKNWYAILNSAMTGRPTKCKCTDGSMRDNSQEPSAKGIGIGAPASNTPNSNSSPTLYYLKTGYTSGGVVMGDGTAEPSADDYKMSGSLITKFSSTAIVTKEDSADGCVLTALYTITNTGSEDITISEIGLTACGNGNPHIGTYMALIERTLLETPVTIPPSSVGQITYTIEVKHPVPFPTT